MLRLYNTLTRSKDEFIPIDKKEVKMYSCGPTVYNYMHIGNLRTFFFEDILLRVLKYNGYNVNYIMNITDVGHLTDDTSEGEDKMEESSRETGKSVWEIAEYYTSEFLDDIKLMNIIPPHKYTKATDYISEQIEMIKCLEDKGYTYRTSDGIYYDTSKFPDYTKLARLDIKGLQEGARIEFSDEKKNITDFALWKFSPKDTKRQMEWESPWGKGFPGWHIECSAMSGAIFGNHFDIHCGGVDHIPVHHTNEIAQSEACSDEKFVNYWLHGEFLNMENEKMSKSLGNFLTLKKLIEMGYSSMDYRYFLLMAHYRRKLKFSFEALDAARNGNKNLINKILNLKADAKNTDNGNAQVNQDYQKKFSEAVNDDLNMPEAMAVMWDLLKDENVSSGEKLRTIYDFDKVFGLRLEEAEESVSEIPEEVMSLIEKRKEAKESKNFKLADEIRDEIRSKGFEILDKKESVEIKKI